MSMFKLYKLSLWVPKRIKSTALLNKQSIVFALSGIPIQLREKSDSKYECFYYSRAVEKLINIQVQAEQQAAQDYLGMAISFLHPQLSKTGAGGFFMTMYEEELGHMQDFLQYQILRGGKPKVSEIKEARVDLGLTLLKAFEIALHMEIKVTKLLEKLVKVAEDEKDYQCADFVTSVFLADQMKSMNEMSHHVTKLTNLQCNEHAIYHYDLELAKTYPYEYKRKS